MDIVILGIDLGKNSCSLVGMDAAGRVVLRRRLRRGTLESFVGELGPCIVAMEACCGAHHLGRIFAARGHEVRLMSPEYVRPYVKAQKNDHLYRALDFLSVWSDEIAQAVFLRTADLFRLDVDLIFYDTTTAYFEIDQADEVEQEWAGRLFAPLRRRGHSKEGRDHQPQVIIAMAVTRDGMPVRSWVLPGDTADVSTVAKIKVDLHAWRLGRCLFVGDAGMYSADNLAALSKGLGRYILAVPMRKLREVEGDVLTRPGRYRKVADHLQPEFNSQFSKPPAHQ